MTRMWPALSRVTFLLGWALCSGVFSPPACVGAEIRINGSGATLDLMIPINDAYRQLHPEIRIEMTRPLGSTGAIKALLAGALDLVVSSKPLSPEQVSAGARAREFGKTPLVIVTERNVPRSNITTGELEAIYAGTMRAWDDGEKIRIVLRPASDVDTTILRGLSPALSSAVDRAQARPGMAIAVTDPEANEAIARIPGAIGASALCSLLVAKPPLNALALNGVKPSAAALADKSYPLAKEIRFVTMGAPAPAVAGLLEFIYSAPGRSIAEQAGVFVTADLPVGKTP